ncbi:MAG: GGDEF domain-containing protein [Betaproteobacteria bacterium]|uniref:GGDEF domain-containing protein n=1 Tax=Candidatus Proximibacter danicus TaxID=2954365 RepID=A0A9D7K5F8_9PROT|nr:GGDEF domain-containing protein [Candidatus Proximibacter danicus]
MPCLPRALLPADSALVVARKILAAIELPFVLDAGTAEISVSLGMALSPNHGQSAEALLAAADAALYAARPLAATLGGWQRLVARTRPKRTRSPKSPVNPVWACPSKGRLRPMPR